MKRNKIDLVLKENFQFRLTKKELEMLNGLSDELKISKSTLLRGLIRAEYLKNIGEKR